MTERWPPLAYSVSPRRSVSAGSRSALRYFGKNDAVRGFADRRHARPRRARASPAAAAGSESAGVAESQGLGGTGTQLDRASEAPPGRGAAGPDTKEAGFGVGAVESTMRDTDMGTWTVTVTPSLSPGEPESAPGPAEVESARALATPGSPSRRHSDSESASRPSGHGGGGGTGGPGAAASGRRAGPP